MTLILKDDWTEQLKDRYILFYRINSMHKLMYTKQKKQGKN